MADLSPHGRELGDQPSVPSPAAPGQVQLWVGGKSRGKTRGRSPSPWWLRLCMGLLATTGLLGGIFLLVLSFRWGLLLMLDPEALPQIQTILTSPLAPGGLSTTTQAELRQAVETTGLVLGAPVTLTDPEDKTDWLIFPILSAESGEIVQLKVFQTALGQRSPAQLTDIATVAVAPLSPELVLAPLSPHKRQTKVTPKSFPAQHLTRLPEPPQPTPYHWLTLEGEWASQGTKLRYGQIVVFEPARRQLALLDPWSSPAQELPQWVDLDGAGITDLVVNETSGLDPALRGLQVIDLQGMGPPVRLQPVSWVEIPLNASTEAHRYQIALRLARSGLWREAHLRLQDLKQTLAEPWNAAAEAQLRLMAHHRDLTQQQANQDWSMPSQKIMALLIDGQWEAALNFLEQTPQQLQPLMRRLAADQGRLWNRISTAASLPGPEPAVLLWGGLTLEAQQNRQAAQTWLDRQSITTAAQERLMGLLANLNPPDSSTTAMAGRSIVDDSPAARPAVVTLAPVQGVMGQVKPLKQLFPEDWYFPEQQPPDLVAGEQWYVVEVPIVRSRQQWLAGWPAAVERTTAEQLWPALPFASTPSLTTVRWQSSTQGMSQNLYVKGVKLNSRTVTLLASGIQMAEGSVAPLAFSDGALVWLSAARHTTPDSHTVLPPLMEEILRHNGPLADQGNTYALGSLLQDVHRHTLDLTGDGHQEQVLTFTPAALDQLQRLGISVDRTAHKTVILTHDNQLVYSDLFQPQTLVALTNPEDGFPLSLLVHRSQGYQLLQWSANDSQFGP